jgi:DNA-binding NtrC family response regulator
VNESKPAPTTLTRQPGPAGTARQGELCLMWLFPRPWQPAQPLGRDAGELLIGRDETCPLRIDDADVSRRHARLHWEGAELVLTDLGSRNGTFRNARRLERAPVRLGDVLRWGGTLALLTDQPGPTSELAPGLIAGPLLRASLSEAERAAPSDLPVILEGETGTGKEVVARTIHGWSRRSGAFLAVNCAALPEALAEGELFGYRKGAFTGADRASPGLFRAASGGTLLLDEVCDLPLPLQAKLLRVLEQREVQPLGETQPVAVDTRIIVAAQEPLRSVVARRQFRADLLARLEGVTVRLPPLRARPGDVPALFARAFAEQSAGQAPALDAELVERLCVYDWPFNVRELVLLAQRLRVLCGDRLSLELKDLPGHLQGQPPPADPRAPERAAAPGPALASETVELPALLMALRSSGGNVAQAATLLGISRQRAYRLMQGQVDLQELRERLREADS